MSFLSDFGINPLLLAAQVVNFLILLWILNRFLYKPILNVLAERRKKIEQGLKDSEEIAGKLRETDEEVSKILAKASLEGQKIIDGAGEQANQIIEEAKLKAGDITAKMLDEAKSRIQTDRENMERELQKDFSKVVMMVVEKITGGMFKQRDQKILVEKAVREFKS